MLGDLKSYRDYRESVVPWVAKLPNHWETRRLRHVSDLRVSNVDKHAKKGELPIRLCNYVNVYKNERITDRLPYMHATATREEIERFTLHLGDVVVTKDSEDWQDIGVPALVEYAASDLICGYHLAILRPRRNQLSGAFLLRALQARQIAAQFRMAAHGVTRYGLSHADIKGVVVPIPSPDEQAAIARFLDHATAKIERAIRTKRKLIALLNEQKQVIVHGAVTRGLDPGVKLKPSGIPWLGDVPEHWQVSSLRFRYHQCLGKMVDAKKAAGRHLIPYLRNVDVRWGHINIRDLPLIDIDPHERERYTVQVGDLLVCEGRHLGRCAFWKGGIDVCGFQKALHRLRPLNRERDDPRFLYYAMIVANATDAFHRNKIDNTIPHLTGEMLRAHRFAFPPKGEQAAIATYLEAALVHVESGLSVSEHEIALLREYRTTLTADVVTGRLDVREAAKRLLPETTDNAVGDDLSGDSETSDEEGA